MRCKRSCSSTTGNTLKYGCVNLQITFVIEKLTHSIKDLCTLNEYVFHFIINKKINISLTVTQFRISEFVKSNPILHLNNGKWSQ